MNIYWHVESSRLLMLAIVLLLFALLLLLSGILFSGIEFHPIRVV